MQMLTASNEYNFRSTTTRHCKMFMWTTASKFLAMLDLHILVAAAALGDIAVKQGTSDEILLCWCLIGGIIGSACSLRFYQVQRNSDALWQFFINLGMAGIFSPWLCDYIGARLESPITIKMILPVSFIVGLFASQATARVLPFIRAYIDAKGTSIVREAGGDVSKFDITVHETTETHTTQTPHDKKE